jgi:hypothetical protein
MGWRAGIKRVVRRVLPGERTERSGAVAASAEESGRQGAVNYRRVEWGTSLAVAALIFAFAAALAAAYERWQANRWGLLVHWNLQNWIVDHLFLGVSAVVALVCVVVLAGAGSGRRRGISWSGWLMVVVASVPLARLVATGAILEWHYAGRGGREPTALLDTIFITSLLARCVLVVAGVLYAAGLGRLWRWRLAAAVAGFPLAFDYLAEAAAESATLWRDGMPALKGIALGLKAIRDLWGGNLVLIYMLPLIFCAAAASAARRRHRGETGGFWPWKKRTWAALALVVFVVAGDQVWVRVNRRIPLGWETTRITAPLTADGYPDYLAAINALESKGVTRENNAAIVLSEIVEFPYQAQVKRKAAFAIWGAPEPGKPLFEDYDSWLAREGPARDRNSTYDEIRSAMTGPWTAAEHPALTRWLAAMEPAFTRMEAASERSVIYVPELTSDGRASGVHAEGGNESIPTVGLNDLVRACIVRAQWRLAEGDGGGFAHDLGMVLRLGRVFAHSGDGRFYMEGAYLHRKALASLQAGAASGRLGVVEAERLGDELGRLGPLPSPAGIANGRGRFYALYEICATNRRCTSGRGGDFESQYLLSWLPLNYERALREENELMDRAVAAFDMASYKRRKEAFAEMEQAFRLRAEGYLFPDLHPELLWQSGLSWGGENDNYTRSLVEMDLARLALALCVAHAREGKYPERLEDLGGAEVVDRFTERPLEYRRKGEGYVLYSLGVNLKDDGGVREGRSSADDLSVEAVR